MRRMIVGSSLVGVIALLLLCCGGPLTPPEACRENARVICAKMFDCTTEDERKVLAWLKDKATCEEQFGGSKCDQAEACGGDLSRYDGAKARECINEIKGISCEQAKTQQNFTDSPACKAICK